MKYYIYYLFAIFLVSYSCNKDETETKTPVLDPPKCEITISSGQSEFNYGDTVFINCQVIIESIYLKQVKLFLNNEVLLSNRESTFSYEIYTNDLDVGEHVLKLSAWDTRDSIGSDSKQIMVNAISPTIVSEEILAIGTDSATLSGRLLSDGGNTATWGLCYNTTGSPTKEENTIQTTDTVFFLKISGLQKLTSYFVRAWATNDYGTSYGKEIEFKTTDESGIFSDFRDDHVYRWVKIGEQVWMAENLAYIPFLTDPTIAPTLDSNIYVYGYMGTDINEAKETENYKTYGALYSWKMATKYCPSGWHLPDTTEWSELIDFLGGEEIAGGKMKERGTVHWEEPNLGATNESGFSDIGAGKFIFSWGGFREIGQASRFWQATSFSELYTPVYGLHYDEVKFYMSGETLKKPGYSVRCVQD